jgi:EpsI family protein
MRADADTVTLRPVARPLTYAAWLCLTLLAGILFADTVRGLLNAWGSDPEFSHGYLIPAIAAYLAWSRRHAVGAALARGLDPLSYYAGAALLLAGVSARLVSLYLSALPLEGAALLLVLAGLTTLCFGTAVLRTLSFPLVYLLLMLPVPHAVYYALADHLKVLIATATALLLGGLGIPVLLEQNVLHLANISLEVHENCSGIGTILGAVALGAAYAFLYLESLRARAIMIAAMVPLGIMVNLIRIAAVGVLSYHASNDAALAFHRHAEWATIPLSLLGVVAIGAALHRWGRPPVPTPADAHATVPPPDGSPLHRRPWVRLATAGLLLSGALLVRPSATTATPIASDLSRLPSAIGPWRAVPIEAPPKPFLSTADASLYRSYQNAEGRTVTLFLGYWGRITPTGSVFDGRNLHPGKGWLRIDYHLDSLTIDGVSLPVQRMVYAHDRQIRIVTAWYQLAQRPIADRYRGRLQFALNTLLGEPPVVGLAIVDSGEGRIEDAALLAGDQAAFIEALWPHWAVLQPPTREAGGR